NCRGGEATPRPFPNRSAPPIVPVLFLRCVAERDTLRGDQDGAAGCTTRERPSRARARAFLTRPPREVCLGRRRPGRADAFPVSIGLLSYFQLLPKAACDFISFVVVIPIFAECFRWSIARGATRGGHDERVAPRLIVYSAIMGGLASAGIVALALLGRSPIRRS